MLCWTDIESTGLIETDGHLLEVALVVTDDDLNEVATTSVVCKPVGVDIDYVHMDPFVLEMHTKNGLIEEVRSSGLRRYEAEIKLNNFVIETFASVPPVRLDKCRNCSKRAEEHDLHPEHSKPLCRVVPEGPPFQYLDLIEESAIKHTPLCGSTVGFDRRWLKAHMPVLEGMWHYHSIDVSSFTETAKRWAPEIYKNRPKGDKAHRALSDIRESIALFRYYCDKGFIVKGENHVST